MALPNRAIRGVRLAHCLCQEVGYLGLAVGSRVTLPGCLTHLLAVSDTSVSVLWPTETVSSVWSAETCTAWTRTTAWVAPLDAWP